MKLLEHLLDLSLTLLDYLVLGEVELSDLQEGLDYDIHVLLDDALQVRGLFNHGRN